MNTTELEELRDSLEQLQDAFGQFDQLLKSLDRNQWERWKAGGKSVSNEFVSMYPCAEECVPDEADVEEDESEG
jgi:hypothetical protein